MYLRCFRYGLERNGANFGMTLQCSWDGGMIIDEDDSND